MSTNYVVIAPLVIAKSATGGDLHVYKDAPVPDGQTADWIKRHLDDKMIVKASDTEAIAAANADEPGGDGPDGDGGGDSTDGKPGGNASREEWLEYALAHGVTEDEAADLSRNDLRDRFAS
jgi:hypothetical protein